LAKRGKLPHVLLPGGEIRFTPNDVERIISNGAHVSSGGKVERIIDGDAPKAGSGVATP